VVVEDVEAIPRTSVVISAPDEATPKAVSEKGQHAGLLLPTNVPSAPLPMPSSLPRPLLRLLLLTSLILSSVMVLVFVPAARLPSMRTASVSRRLALAEDGRAYYDIEKPVSSWNEAKDRDYRPPQIRTPHIVKRAAPAAIQRVPAPHPKASRPSLSHRPLPLSHELLALQSYLLQSTYNVLPHTIDPLLPLDANVVLSVGTHKLGPIGSDDEKSWLADLEKEREDDVVIWYGADGTTQPPHAVLDVLSALAGSHRHPTLIPCHGRRDLPLIRSIFDRLDIPIQHHPLIMIGNTPIVGDIDGLEELRGSGKLREMLKKIGWVKEEDGSGKKKAWKPKMAKVKKRQVSEVERALKQA